MTDRTPEPQDLVKRLRNGFDNIPTVLEWKAADAIEELTAALRLAEQTIADLQIHEIGRGPDHSIPIVAGAELRLRTIAALLSKYGASNG